MLRDASTPSRSNAGGINSPAVCLVLESVLGSTVSSINALSAAIDTKCFAFCAGSTVVLAEINSELRLNQRFFFVKPDALPAQVTPSYYNPATPTKATGNRALVNVSCKDDSGLSFAPFDCNVDSVGKEKSSHRFRSVTSVALSPSGKYLAIGEVGFHPRILVFSTAPGVLSDTPLACLTEHTYGVQAIAFSHDSRWLCSLGDVRDGGLFLWSINPKTGALKLDSSNRCTTADTIAWMGTGVVTVGTRHVKVWRFEQPSSPEKTRRGLDTVHDSCNASPAPRTFAGRNVLLGPLKDAVFTCVVGISEDAAVLCTRNGAICLLDDAHRSQRLFQVSKKNYSITCVTLDQTSSVVWIAGKGAEPESLPLSLFFALRNPSITLEQHTSLHALDERRRADASSICATCYTDNRLVAIDLSRGMFIYGIGSDHDRTPEVSAIQQLTAHSSAVVGVVVSKDSTVNGFDFLTYSGRGDILYWLWDGKCTDGQVKAVVRGHDGEMHDLTVHEIDDQQSLAASSGRDKTIQIFRVFREECSLEQSLINEHAGPIRQVQFARTGSTLVSMSSDRTLVLHQKITRIDNSIAFVSTKTIHLKASPMSISLLPDVAPWLLLSAMDRCVRKISLIEGSTMQTFKTTDLMNGESVALSRLTVGTIDRQTNILAGFSSADGSIRLYDVETGSLLAAIQGQTAVSDLTLAQVSESSGARMTRLISTGGSDGTVMLWKLKMPSQEETKHLAGDAFSNMDPSKSITPSSMRLVRRVLSKAEIAGFQRSLKEKVDNTASPRNLSPSRLRRKSSRYAIPGPSNITGSNHSSATRSPEALNGSHRNRVKHSSGGPISPKVSLQSRNRRSSLDERYRHTVVDHTHDIDSTAEQISNALQDFRTVVANCKESLNTRSMQALEGQLQATLAIIAPLRHGSVRKGDEQGSESFDDYLAKMIDERIALRSRTEEHVNSCSGGQGSNVSPRISQTDRVALQAGHGE
ncbi:MAG: hypothetical protein Q9213_003382 [Squamulea squamosa]